MSTEEKGFETYADFLLKRQAERRCRRRRERFRLTTLRIMACVAPVTPDMLSLLRRPRKALPLDEQLGIEHATCAKESWKACGRLEGVFSTAEVVREVIVYEDLSTLR